MTNKEPVLVGVASRPIESLGLYHVLPGSRALVVGLAHAEGDDGSVDAIEGPSWPLDALPSLAATGRCASVGFTHEGPRAPVGPLLAALAFARQSGLATVLRCGERLSVPECDAFAPSLDAVVLEIAPFRARNDSADASHPMREVLARLRHAGVWVEVVTLLDGNASARDLVETALSLKAIDGAMPWHLRCVRQLVAHQKQLATSVVAQAVRAGERAGLENVYAPEAASGDREITFCPVCRDVVLIERFFGQPQSFLADGRRCPRCGTRARGLFAPTIATASA